MAFVYNGILLPSEIHAETYAPCNLPYRNYTYFYLTVLPRKHKYIYFIFILSLS